MQPQQNNEQRVSTIPNVIFALLIINGLTFAAQQMLRIEGMESLDYLTLYFALWPPGVDYTQFRWPPSVDPTTLGFGIWQFVTYGFLHDTQNLLHIVFNMFMLWMFGREVELVMGARRFLTYYLVCVVGAGFVQLLVAHFTDSVYPTLGASGGVFGILLAFGMLFPNRTIMLIFPPIPMPAKYMVIFFMLLELYLGISGSAPGIANFAHVGGMLFGFLLIRYWTKVRRR